MICVCFWFLICFYIRDKVVNKISKVFVVIKFMVFFGKVKKKNEINWV